MKTGRLFAAAVGLGLWAADVPEAEQAPWRAFGEELGVLFQAVDDVIDGDGYAAELGDDGARGVAAEAAAARTSGSPRSTPTRRCSPSSSTSSPSGRSEPLERRGGGCRREGSVGARRT